MCIYSIHTCRRIVLETCRDDQFTCTNGQCIAADDVCNFKFDCVDGSDENQQACGMYPTYLACDGLPSNGPIKLHYNLMDTEHVVCSYITLCIVLILRPQNCFFMTNTCC